MDEIGLAMMNGGQSGLVPGLDRCPATLGIMSIELLVVLTQTVPAAGRSPARMSNPR